MLHKRVTEGWPMGKSFVGIISLSFLLTATGILAAPRRAQRTQRAAAPINFDCAVDDTSLPADKYYPLPAQPPPGTYVRIQFSADDEASHRWMILRDWEYLTQLISGSNEGQKFEGLIYPGGELGWDIERCYSGTFATLVSTYNDMSANPGPGRGMYQLQAGSAGTDPHALIEWGPGVE